jgi:heme exporter protein D
MAGFLAWFWSAVFPNLVASAITGSAVWLWARRKILHLHRRLDHQDSRLAAIHQQTVGGSDAAAR